VNCGLKVLDLSFNAITLRGSVAIATALKKNKTLEVLRLAWNGFSLLGCMALSDALRLNHTLLELDLRYINRPKNHN
jgi:Ran GTPase-activating protein (RanGAP) involved in mRNA processing and transport